MFRPARLRTARVLGAAVVTFAMVTPWTAPAASASAGAEPVAAETVAAETVSFSASSVPVGAWPKSLALADFDHDPAGTLDAAVGNRGSTARDVAGRTIQILPGAGDGSFAPPAQTFSTPGRGVAFYLAAADLDGDGWSDLIAADVTAREVVVFRNVGGAFGGEFLRLSVATDTDRRVAEDALPLVVEDLNADGRPDIVALHRAGDTVFSFTNTSSSGAVSFEQTTTTLADTAGLPVSDPWVATAADLDSDGAPDIAVLTLNTSNAASTPGTLAVLRNTSAPGSAVELTQSSTAYAVGNWPYAVTAGDLDADGRADLALVDAFSRDLRIFRNAGTGPGEVQLSGTTYPVGRLPKSVAVADVDGDCVRDVVVANHFGSPQLSFFLTAPAGSQPLVFAREAIQTVPGLQRPVALRAADLDGDGATDLLMNSPADDPDAAGAVNDLVSLRNMGATTCR